MVFPLALTPAPGHPLSPTKIPVGTGGTAGRTPGNTYLLLSDLLGECSMSSERC